MATWPPQRSKQNCLAAQPELSLKGFSVSPGPRAGGSHGALTHALNSPRRPGPTLVAGFCSPKRALIWRNLSGAGLTGVRKWLGVGVGGTVYKLSSPTRLERKPS